MFILNRFTIFAESFKYMLQYFDRDSYSERITRLFERGVVVVLTGQRRVGKSCIMRIISNRIARDDNNNVIFIDKEKSAFDDIATGKDLEIYVNEHLAEDKSNYLFIDEVQEISEFEKGVLSLLSDGKCQIMLTGSNAKMLSGELATRLRGRYMSYRIDGLSYPEFLRFHNLTDNDSALRQFLQYGGLPQLRLLGLDNEDLIDDYLKNVCDTIVLRDIVEHENIRNIPLLRMLLRFIADNIGKQFSARNIANFLKVQNVDTSANIIISYLEYLCNAFIIGRISRYDIHGKKIFEFGDSYYFEDIGIRNHLAGTNRRFDIEKVMENAVYRHLTRLGYEVFIGQLQKAEIDFVAEKTGSRIYVQVTYMLASEETVEREFGNLKMIKDNHPKYVVSMDNIFGNINEDGIRHMHLRDFLKTDVL